MADSATRSIKTFDLLSENLNRKITERGIENIFWPYCQQIENVSMPSSKNRRNGNGT